MATTTTNFGWDIPQSTDLVKDGATAIAALGQDIDTAMVDLKGGTTGQVLSKTSNTDLDFTWVTDAAGDITGVTAGTGISGGGTSGTVTVTNSMATAIDAKGDLIGGTGADTFSRLAVGTNGQVLTADSAETTGLKWANAAGGGSLIYLSRADFSATTTINFNSVFTSTYKSYMIIVQGVVASATSMQLRLRASGTNSTINYSCQAMQAENTSVSAFRANLEGSFYGAEFNTEKSSNIFYVYNPATAVTTGLYSLGGQKLVIRNASGLHEVETAYDGFSLVPGSNFTGYVQVYGFKES
jgi:hypothetical protein